MVDRDRSKAKAAAIAAIREHGNGIVDAVKSLLLIRSEELKDELAEAVGKGENGQIQAGAVQELKTLAASLSARPASRQKSGSYAGQHDSSKRPRP